MKYLRFQLLAVLACLTAVLQAQTNILRVSSVSYPAGKTLSLPVELDNASDIVAVQFDISVPFELALDEAGNVPVTLSKTRAANHSVSSRKTGGTWRTPTTHGGINYYHNYRIMVYSDVNAYILDDHGTLLTIDLPLPGNLENGTTFPIYLVDGSVVLSDRQQQNVVTGQENGVVTIEEIPRPDLTPADITFEPSAVGPNEELIVRWKVSNIGKVATEDGWSEQISLVATNGNVTKLIGTTYYEEPLAAGATISRETKVMLPALPGIDGLAYVQVTIVPTEKTGEHPSDYDNNTLNSTEKLTVNKLLTLELSRLKVSEKSGQRVQCKLSRSGRWNNIRTFTVETTPDPRVDIPEKVTIPANQSGVVFYMNIVNNDVLDADSVVYITVSGDGYDPVTARFVIEDDEYPDLTVVSSKSVVQEGETFQLTISAARASKEPVVVSLTSEDSKRFEFPSQVTIPAEETTVTVDVKAIDNDVPNLELANKFTVSAPYYNKGEVIVVLQDNDMPLLTLTLTPDKVSESAGVTAVAAVLTRTGKTDNKITIRISDDSNGGLYYSNKTLEMPKGVETVYFNLGPVDNTLKEGDRTYNITAGVWVSSCNCAAAGEQAGAVTAQLTVLDNDGASLSVASQSSTVKEGDKTVLTITRNTVANEPLTVRLSSNYDAELTYEHTVTIPAGEKSVDVEVTSAPNDVSGDSHTVIFTVEADGYSSGTCYLLVTDQTLPDARITSLTADPTETVVGGTVTLNLVLANEGAAPLPEGTAVKFYKKGNSEAIGTLRTEDALAVGAMETLQRRITLPDEVGDHVYYAVVNESQTVTELIYTNNTSEEVTVKATSPFTATVTTDKKIYTQSETVIITGRLTGDRAANADAEVYFLNDGVRQTEPIKTDAGGAFTLEWTPYALQSGHFIIGACYPGDKTTEEQASFDIYGLKRANNSYITEDVIVGDTRQGIVPLVNPGKLGLTGVKAEKVSGPENVQVELDIVESIPAEAEALLTYRLTGTEPTIGNNWEQIGLRVTSAEGASVDITIHYYGRAATGNLVVESHQLNTTMVKDQGRDYSFIVTNNGRGNTGKVTLALPDWISSLTGTTMAGLAQNDTTTVVLRLMPTSNMQLNVPVTGRIGINCENGNGTYIDYSITPVSDAKGTLVVDVADEYTYYTEEKPHVAGAQIVLRNPVTGALVAEGVSGEDGLYSIELPEGYYQLNVTADNHDSYRNNILVDPGTTTKKVVNLSYQAVTVSWDVVETEVEDEYNIVTTVKYETNVPMPVVETIVPDKVDAASLGVGESLVFYAVLTNKGLITAKETTFSIPEYAGKYHWETLVDCKDMDLAPQQSVVIPVKVTRIDTEPAGARKVDVKPGCHLATSTMYSYECGDDHKYHLYANSIQYEACPANVSGGGGGGGWGGGGAGYPNGYGYGGYYGGSTGGERVHIDMDCDPCLNQVVKRTYDCVSSFVPVWGCVYGLADCTRSMLMYQANGFDKFMCALTAIGCIPGPHGVIINIFNCLGSFGSLIVNGCSPSGTPVGAPLRAPSDTGLPSYVTAYAEKSQPCFSFAEAMKDYMIELFGDSSWLEESSSDELKNFLTAVRAEGMQGLLSVESMRQYKPENITNTQLTTFVERVNNTVDYEATGTTHDNMISNVKLTELAQKMVDADDAAKAAGYESLTQLWTTETGEFLSNVEGGDNSVCATITLQINQTMTMTRQAFRGTLTVYNGSKSQAMEDVKLRLNVTNKETGLVVTAHEMEMHTESLKGFTGELPMDAGWHLDAEGTGTATILFIPTKYAAPETPVDYSFGGTLSYVDPYTGLEVTRELYPVTLTVKPSPELDLTYFMQRDIYGDDPLTEEVEPMTPAEFAVVINNKGYGDATNVKMVTNQPEIIDNKKGLLIDFQFVSSQLNGEDKTLSLGQSIPTDFGTIPAHSQAYAQWWLQSTLLGHFVDYDIEATHVTSFGNEDLSLLDQVTIHELIHGFTPLTADDGTNVRAFLVNDVADAEDQPDQVYFTNATQQDVNVPLNAVINKQSDTEYLLTVMPRQNGWTYGSLLDPTVGKQKLMRVVRQRDNADINLDNVWQTDRTLIDGKEWLYENRLHFVGDMPVEGETFVLTFADKPAKELAVQEFVGVPKEGTVATEKVEQITVRFNKAIVEETFTTEDVTIACQGKPLDAAKIVIAKQTDTDYALDLTAVTGGDGYYVLTVQTAGITDAEGFTGATGRQATWIQYVGGKVSLVLKASPEEGGTITPESGLFDYGQTVTLTATPAEGYDFAKWLFGDATLSESAEYNYTPQGDAELTAVFSPKYFDVVIDYNTNGGQVTGGGTGLYTYGTELSLTATTLPGYVFDGWVIDDVVESTEATFQWKVTGNVTIKALFTELPTGILTGKVTAAADDTPIANATVTLQSGDMVYTATTDLFGIYRMEVADKSLTYDVSCHADGFMWSSTEQIWFTGQEEVKNFVLLRGATALLPAEGVCTFSAPIAVTLTNQTVKAWYLSRYDEQSFVLEEIKAGSLVANEGVVLSGVAGQRIDFSEAVTALPISGNMLTGTAYAPYIVTADNVYEMRENTDSEACFYLADQGVTIPQGKAYCRFTISGSPARVGLVWSDASFVQMIKADVMDADSKHYDLQGRRIYQVDGSSGTSQKRIHVVKGRKVVMK